jgi:inositol 1,4,5-triphosphate receptor type 1/inositol 1,4,5-triphosphate receptor type 3
MYTFFQLFQGLIEDGNEINIGKCKNMHPYHKLLQMLPWTQNCWPLKKHLRGYINRLYYMGEEYEEMS